MRERPGAATKARARLKRYEALLAEEEQREADTVQINIPPGPCLGDVVIEAEGRGKGYGDWLLIDDLFSGCRRRHRRRDRPERRRQDHAVSDVRRRREARRRRAPLGDTVEPAYVDQSRDALDPAKTVWEEISDGADQSRSAAAR